MKEQSMPDETGFAENLVERFVDWPRVTIPESEYQALYRLAVVARMIDELDYVHDAMIQMLLKRAIEAWRIHEDTYALAQEATMSYVRDNLEGGATGQ